MSDESFLHPLFLTKTSKILNNIFGLECQKFFDRKLWKK